MRDVLLCGIAILFIHGCATQVPQQTGAGPGGGLLAQADKHVVAGENAQAVALLERVVRIEPRNGHAWLRLAKVHFVAGDLYKADQFARRAMQFAAADKVLKREIHVVLEKVRRQMKQAS